MRQLSEFRSFLSDTYSFFTLNQKGQRPWVLIFVYLTLYSVLLLYEIYEPDFYEGTRAERMGPAFLWVSPPVVLASFIALVADYRKQLRNELQGGGGEAEAKESLRK